MASFRFNYFERKHNSDSLLFQNYDNLIRKNTERQYETAIELVANLSSLRLKSSREQRSDQSSEWQIPSSLNESSLQSNYSHDFNFVKTKNVVPSLRFAEYIEQEGFKVIPKKAKNVVIPKSKKDKQPQSKTLPPVRFVLNKLCVT